MSAASHLEAIRDYFASPAEDDNYLGSDEHAVAALVRVTQATQHLEENASELSWAICHERTTAGLLAYLKTVETRNEAALEALRGDTP